MSSVRVVIVEDDPRFGRALELAVRSAADLELCARFRTVEALRAALADPQSLAGAWGVVIMDLGLPGASGLDGIRGLKRRFPSVRVLVCTVYQDTATIVDALQAGADGYCVKGTQGPELLARIREVAAGGSSLDEVATRSLVEVVRERVPATEGSTVPHRPPLTERERDVLRCLARGDSYEGAAGALGISLHTVRTHIRATYRKLGVRNVAEAVSRAVRDRLL